MLFTIWQYLNFFDHSILQEIQKEDQTLRIFQDSNLGSK